MKVFILSLFLSLPTLGNEIIGDFPSHVMEDDFNFCASTTSSYLNQVRGPLRFVRRLFGNDDTSRFIIASSISCDGEKMGSFSQSFPLPNFNGVLDPTEFFLQHFSLLHDRMEEHGQEMAFCTDFDFDSYRNRYYTCEYIRFPLWNSNR